VNNELRSELYSFLGNSLLKIMTADTAIGLDREFWRSLPLADIYEATNEQMEQGVAELQRVARELQDLDRARALERVGVEYTRLFIGPGAPAAPPWETLYREGGTVLFGQPTIDMRRLFGEQGYQARAESHQFEDHIGFELLYLAMRYAGMAESEQHSVEPGTVSAAGTPSPGTPSSGTPSPGTSSQTSRLVAEELRTFIFKHPLSFVEALYDKALASCADNPSSPGYYPALINLVHGALRADAESLGKRIPS
jgi:TorA maturation chaperone TorD